MGQITVGQLLDFLAVLRRKGMSLEEFRALPIYLGDDDELNGIHCAWCIDVVDANDHTENNEYLVEMINENGCNIELNNGKAILIS